MAQPGNKGLKRILNAFVFSMQGFAACFKTEEAFRQEIMLAVVMVPFAFWLGDTAVEHVLLIGSVLIVFIVELLNTAVERAIDRISFDRHELSKEAKDMGSAAVFTALIMALFTWACIGVPKFF